MTRVLDAAAADDISGMKALVIQAPFALLAINGAKRWETRTGPPAGPMCSAGVRPTPGHGIEPGERIVIVLGRTPYRYDDHPEAWDQYATEFGAYRPGDQWAHAFCSAVDGWGLVGAAIGTVAITGALPIDNGPCTDSPHIFTSTGDLWDEALVLCSGRATDQATHMDNIYDQYPLGDWRPGRWAWQLTDPTPLAVPVPVTGRQGVFRIPEANR